MAFNAYIYITAASRQLVRFTFVLFQYAKLKELQRQSYIHYFYEATVGAGLPIIRTLRGLLETGDKIVKVEGIFRSVCCICWLRLSVYKQVSCIS